MDRKAVSGPSGSSCLPGHLCSSMGNLGAWWGVGWEQKAGCAGANGFLKPWVLDPSLCLGGESPSPAECPSPSQELCLPSPERSASWGLGVGENTNQLFFRLFFVLIRNTCYFIPRVSLRIQGYIELFSRNT